MCLGIPAKGIELIDAALTLAIVDIAGQRRQCSAMYVPEVAVGDWVFIQNGFIMNLLDEEEARQSLAAIAEYDLIAQVAQAAPRGRAR